MAVEFISITMALVAAMEAYSSFSEHKKVAMEKIRPYVQSKLVMDYLI